MIDIQIKNIADIFIRSLQSLPEVIEYYDTLSKYENDDEMKVLTQKYYLLSSEIQKKQYDGNLTQEKIDELRSIIQKIQNNPINIELYEKQNNLRNILIECNNLISDELGMDFAKLVAPSTC